MTSDPTRHRDAPRRQRTWHRLIAFTVLITTAALLPAPAAHAAASATCTGSSAISYSPGLTFTPQTVTYSETDTLTSCTSTVSGLTSGTSGTVFTLPGASCLAAPSLNTDPTFTITWNTGQHSVINLTFTDLIVAGTEQVTGTGTVTSGPFTGGNATVVWVYPVLNPLQCLASPGLTSQSGTLIAQLTLI
ncbi:hypothetical protein ACLQ2R_25645 [Streptosporangium sp. DT93]|uniref:hypothetical protein n=1 Tax=Streptosporangium sp. DT93 TaxID=3393428 RepID=UPI003CEFCA6F